MRASSAIFAKEKIERPQKTEVAVTSRNPDTSGQFHLTTHSDCNKSKIYTRSSQTKSHHGGKAENPTGSLRSIGCWKRESQLSSMV